MSEVTNILNQIEAGDPRAAEQLLPLVYEHLKNLAAAKMVSERPDHTLQATALVHEAYLRLVDSSGNQNWDGRGHFFAAAAEAMRRILLNHAREKSTAKRGANWGRVTLDAITAPGGVDPGELIAVDDAMEQLERQDVEAAKIAKMRIFAGLTIPEIADALNIGRRTVDRQWAFARAWLRTNVSDNDESSDS
jgi:RNA polymerase sigma factor (TIGR02999 family)